MAMLLHTGFNDKVPYTGLDTAHRALFVDGARVRLSAEARKLPYNRLRADRLGTVHVRSRNHSTYPSAVLVLWDHTVTLVVLHHKYLEVVA